MTQLLLDLRPNQPPSLDNFIVGENGELLSRLQLLSEPDCFDALYLWGAAGCGKSYLLTAVAALAMRKRPVLLLSGCRPVSADLHAPPRGLLLVDDVDALDDDMQTALFRIFNTARRGLGLLLTGHQPPAQLKLREDLRTRIGQTLIYEVKTLSDEQKAAALCRHALERGLKVEDGLLRYLLVHGRRDLPSLMAVLDHLDRATLERQCPANLTMLKEALQLQLIPDNDESRPV